MEMDFAAIDVGQNFRKASKKAGHKTIMAQMNLSARGYHRLLKLARTIADLAGSESIQAAHLAKALQYRPKLLQV